MAILVSDPGIYKRFRAPNSAPRPAVFLDRDGVLVEEVGYLHHVEDIALIPSAPQAIAKLNAAAIPAVVVTNQAGIGRGYYSWREFEIVQSSIETALHPATFDGVWACAYHPDGTGDLACDHVFRKPNPGMILDAAETLGIDLAASWLVGDKTLDIESAINAGLAGAILVRTGYGASMEPELDKLPKTSCRIHVCDHLGDAVAVILHTSAIMKNRS